MLARAARGRPVTPVALPVAATPQWRFALPAPPALARRMSLEADVATLVSGRPSGCVLDQPQLWSWQQRRWRKFPPAAASGAGRALRTAPSVARRLAARGEAASPPQAAARCPAAISVRVGADVAARNLGATTGARPVPSATPSKVAEVRPLRRLGGAVRFEAIARRPASRRSMSSTTGPSRASGKLGQAGLPARRGADWEDAGPRTELSELGHA